MKKLSEEDKNKLDQFLDDNKDNIDFSRIDIRKELMRDSEEDKDE